MVDIINNLIIYLIWSLLAITELGVSMLLFARVVIPAMTSLDEFKHIKNENKAISNFFTINMSSMTITIVIIIAASIYHAEEYGSQILIFIIGFFIILGSSLVGSRLIIPLLTPFDEFSAMYEDQKIAHFFNLVNAIIIVSVGIIFAISIIT